jgi:protein-S-isoprenylcysteine O-methyltransferase Ste14
MAEFITGVAVLSAFGFYAAKLLGSFKTGMLERGWKQVTIGAIVLVLAQFFFIGSGISSSSIVSLLLGVGTLMRLIGLVFLTLGLRTHYQIWRLDNKDLTTATASSEPLEC